MLDNINIYWTFETLNNSLSIGSYFSSNSEIGIWIYFALKPHLATLCDGRAGRCSSKYRSQMAGAEMVRSVPVQYAVFVSCYGTHSFLNLSSSTNRGQ